MNINAKYYFAQVEQLSEFFKESEKTMKEQIVNLEAQKLQLEEVRFDIYPYMHPSIHSSINFCKRKKYYSYF